MSQDLQRFLKHFRPDGYTCFVAIEPDGPTRTRTFNGVDLDATIKWIDGQNAAGRNIYYTVNPTSPHQGKKPDKVDICECAGIWSDIDPLDGDGRAWSDERTRLAALADELHASDTPPSFIVDSGNGIQPVWMLEDPLGPEHQAAAEGLCRQIEHALGASGTFNFDRLLRVPGTRNYPNARKVRVGRTETTATLLKWSWRRYDWSELEALADHLQRDPPKHAIPIAATDRKTRTEPGERLDSIPKVTKRLRRRFDATLAKDPKLRARWEGAPPDGPAGDTTRNAYDCALAHYMRRHGYTLGEYAAIAHRWEYGKGSDGDARHYARCWAAVGEKQQHQPNSAYFVRDGGLWRTVQTRAGPTEVPLTNFVATIVGEVVLDDGVETSRQLEIAAQLNSRSLRFAVPAGEFSSLNWAPRELGGRAHIHPGLSTRDHARYAIQVLSPEYAERRVFAHTGWREIDGKMMYLHGGGAIGADGLRTDFETDLGGDLEHFILPAPGDPRASLTLLDLAPLETSASVLALVYRAAIDASDMTGHLAGPTGVFKSELAALAQQHFAPGKNARRLVGWHSTGNSLEMLAFSAKDALLVIDDYAPGGGTSDMQRLQREAARVIRAQGNRAGRGRLRPDGKPRPTKPPRCTILSTGEDIPGGQSIRARMIVIDIADGDIDPEKLTAAQEQAAEGKFAGAMAAFITYLATDLDRHRQRFRARRTELRQEAQATHRRTAWVAGELGASLEIYLEFADALDRWPACWDALRKMAAAQDQYQADEDPARRFLLLVGALLSSHQAHLGWAGELDPALAAQVGWQQDGTNWRSHGPLLGWIGDDDSAIVYLDPEAAYAASQRFAVSQGQPLPVGKRTLWKRLSAAGWLAATDVGRSTTKVLLAGQRRRVVAVPLRRLYILPERA